jgi:pimeloyl-ACP methyl ester carboxylesterase
MSLNAVWSGPADAPVVVLVHGLAGSPSTWTPVIPLLNDRLRIAAVNLPGGRGIEDEADAVGALLREAQVPRATIAGHSMGGHVATALAERSPDLVDGLVLVDTAPTVESRLTADSGSERILRLPVLGALVWSTLSDAKLRSGLRSAFAPGVDVPEPFVDDLRATSHRSFVGSTKAIDAYLRARPLAARLGDLDVPVDVVFGLRDRRVDPMSLSVYDGLARVRVRAIEDAGHTPPWEAPEVLAGVIRETRLAQQLQAEAP